MMNSTSIDADTGPVMWRDDGIDHMLPLRWIRFECPCAECRVEQTTERRFLPLDPAEFVASQVQSSADGVVVRWHSGHVSKFAPEQLRASMSVANRALSAPELWGGGGSPSRFDHDGVMADKEATIAFLTCLRDEGAAVLTRTPSIPGQLEETMSTLGLPLRETFSERIHDVWVDPSGYNIAHTNEGLPPHSDYPSYSYPPSGQVLHMIVNECSGGDSFVVDGWNAAERIRATAPELFDVLATVEIPFRQYSSERESFARQPIVKTDANGVVVAFRFSNQLMRPLHPSDDRFDRWMEAYMMLASLLADTANHRQFRLSSGDALFVHGQRVLHGRTEFVVDGKRHLQDCYFDMDDVKARTDRLSGLAVAKTIAGAA